MAPAGRALGPRVLLRTAVAAAGLLVVAATPAFAVGAVPAGVSLPAPARPALGATAASQSSGGGTQLVGTFRVTAGSCSGTVSGSYFRMVQPGGSAASGPFVSNSDSPCHDQSYTPLSPGSDGGLRTAAYQGEPTPAFDSTGNGLAGLITKPQKFYGVDFATSTDRTDPQTGTSVGAPVVSSNGGRLSGDLRAFSVAWNNQQFNQGSPKPDGGHPGVTAGPTGTYDPGTGAYRLDWTSQIVGGPFNNFAGVWHLEGTFVPSSSTSQSSASQSSSPAPASTPDLSSQAPASSGGDGGSASAAATAGPAGSLPTTGWGAPLGPLAGLLAGGLALRRLGRRHPIDGSGR